MGKIEGLPLPIKDRSTASWKKTHDTIVALARKMLDDRALTNFCEEDLEIDRLVNKLYGIAADDSIHITSQFGYPPYHKALKELFPRGQPKKPIKKI
ncbi:MAG: hypothetical protein Q6365_014765, partial [Candidatus Sigynarchaeota archaeon]